MRPINCADFPWCLLTGFALLVGYWVVWEVAKITSERKRRPPSPPPDTPADET